MAQPNAAVEILKTDLTKHVAKVAEGKARELYALQDAATLLFVTTDRISAFDVVMLNGVPGKGAILTALSVFWFKLLAQQLPRLHTHFIAAGLPRALRAQLDSGAQKHEYASRSMVVKRLKVVPIESIVRGYITGSAWASYQKDGTVCGISLPSGLRQSERLPEPLWTPSTKAEAGQKDENISPDQAAQMIGQDYAAQIKSLSLNVFEIARDYALERGIILADTKFEFALDEGTSPPTLVLCDEVLTPDSSRFWWASKYEVGRDQESLDKQILRNWLIESGQKGQGVQMPAEVVQKTASRYHEALNLLTGKTLEDLVTEEAG